MHANTKMEPSHCDNALISERLFCPKPVPAGVADLSSGFAGAQATSALEPHHDGLFVWRFWPCCRSVCSAWVPVGPGHRQPLIPSLRCGWFRIYLLCWCGARPVLCGWHCEAWCREKSRQTEIPKSQTQAISCTKNTESHRQA